MVFVYLGIAIVVALVAWLFGSVVARIAGIFLAVFGVLGMVTSGARDEIGVAALVVFVFGFALWLAGHWMFAYKHHYFASALARRLFKQTPLRRIDPTRGWGIPVVRE